MVSQVQTQEETEEKLRKRKFIVLTGLRGDTPFRATWGNTRVIRRQSTGARQSSGPAHYWGFCGKSKQGQVKDLRLASLSGVAGLHNTGMLSLGPLLSLKIS